MRFKCQGFFRICLHRYAILQNVVVRFFERQLRGMLEFDTPTAFTNVLRNVRLSQGLARLLSGIESDRGRQVEARDREMNSRSDVHFLSALIFAIIALAGCNSDMPFDMVPVTGKVTYEDGSLIPADSIQVKFNPILTGPKTNISPPGGHTEVNVQDGTFSAVSSHRANDGLVVGRHKVVVVALKKDASGSTKPTDAVPEIYRQESTTPLEIEVTSSDQPLDLKVRKK
jgi:hypothetical protein